MHIQMLLHVLLGAVLSIEFGHAYWVSQPVVPNGSFAYRAPVNMSLPSNVTCAPGTESCAHVGHPEVCCPYVLLIGPGSVELESTCFLANNITTGIACCSDNRSCKFLNNHPSPEAELKCLDGYFECTEGLGGGCCPDGFACEWSDCVQSQTVILTNQTYNPGSGPEGHAGNSLQGATCNSGSSLKECSPTAERDRSPIPNGNTKSRDARRSLKIGKTNVLKTGEIVKIPPNIVPGAVGGAVNGAAQDDEGVAGPVVLTLTQDIGSVVTGLPDVPVTSILSNGLTLPSGVPGTGNTVGTLESPIKSGGHSSKRHGISAPSSLTYLALLFGAQLFNLFGMGI